MRFPPLRPVIGSLLMIGLFALTIYKWYVGHALDRVDLALLIGGSVGLGVATITSVHQLGLKVKTLTALLVGLVFGFGAAFVVTISLGAFELTDTKWLIIGQVVGGILGGYLSYWEVVRAKRVSVIATAAADKPATTATVTAASTTPVADTGAADNAANKTADNAAVNAGSGDAS